GASGRDARSDFLHGQREQQVPPFGRNDKPIVRSDLLLGQSEQQVPHRAWRPVLHDIALSFTLIATFNQESFPVWVFAQVGCDIAYWDFSRLALNSCHSDARPERARNL